MDRVLAHEAMRMAAIVSFIADNIPKRRGAHPEGRAPRERQNRAES